MNIIVFLVVGVLAGWFSGILMGGHGFGVLADLLVGIVGAFVGGFVFSLLGVTAYGFWGSFVMSVIGAVVFLFVVSLFSNSYRSGKKLGKL